jgi:P-aminobenzoate N-oxygenase AurF
MALSTTHRSSLPPPTAQTVARRSLGEPRMTDIAQVARKMTKASKKFFYDPSTRLEWPEHFDANEWAMTPELVSLHGTPIWDGLNEAERKKLAFYEAAGFFSLILNGERPLLEGMSHRLYVAEKDLDVTEYMHHFLDEENKHMMMFSTFCRKYVGKVYPEKKIPFAREMAKGEEDITFFTKVLVVEELSDYYNVVIADDERVAKIARDLNRTHHVDEARHIHFGREYLRGLWHKHASHWTPKEIEIFRTWLVDYVNASWRDFCNPSVYRDAGIADGYAAREMVLRSPACRARRQAASARFLRNLVESEILPEVPELQ